MVRTCTPEESRMHSHPQMDHRATTLPDSAAPTSTDDGHAGMHVMGADVTRPQIAAISLLTLLALIAALLWSANHGNLTLGVHDVAGAVMAPGMIMTRDTPGESMRDMAAVDPNTISFTAPVDARGDQELVPRIENGVKVFDLEASGIEWYILPDEPVLAYAFNQQVPGPRIRVTEGDRVRINVTNHLLESTTVHWHGLILPNEMDGAGDLTQEPIARVRRLPTNSPPRSGARTSTTPTITSIASRP